MGADGYNRDGDRSIYRHFASHARAKDASKMPLTAVFRLMSSILLERGVADVQLELGVKACQDSAEVLAASSIRWAMRVAVFVVVIHEDVTNSLKESCVILAIA